MRWFEFTYGGFKAWMAERLPAVVLLPHQEVFAMEFFRGNRDILHSWPREYGRVYILDLIRRFRDEYGEETGLPFDLDPCMEDVRNVVEFL